MELIEPDGEILLDLSVSSLQEPPLEDTKGKKLTISSSKMHQRHRKETRPVAYGLLAMFVTPPFAEGLAKATGKMLHSTVVIMDKQLQWSLSG